MSRNISAFLAFLLCSVSPAFAQHHEESATGPHSAIAVITPTRANTVRGFVTFTQLDHGVRVVANLTGLTPGKHGFHIHEYGDCSADDATSAGGHYNPTGMKHSMPTSATRHEGDMGNIEANESGNAHLEYVDDFMTLSGEHSIIGHAVIVHEKEDDFVTQPTGNAGARVGCGVIGIAKEVKK